MNYWFTADCHLGHKNIIDYCSRPFTSLEDMNATIIRKWNERVKPDDLVFHVGDFCFKSANDRGEGENKKAISWEEQLNGKKIFIRGNHDKNNSTKTIIENLVITYDNKIVNLSHDPEKTKSMFYEINFTGHVHNLWQCERVRADFKIIDCINVGVDVWNFYPVSFQEIMARYKSWKGAL